MKIVNADRVSAMARGSARREAGRASPEAKIVREKVLSELMDQIVDSAKQRSAMRQSSLVVNLPAPAGVFSNQKLDYGALDGWKTVLSEGVNAALSSLVAKNYIVHSLRQSTSSFNGDGCVIADIGWRTGA